MAQVTQGKRHRYCRRVKDSNPFSTVPPIILLGSALVSGAVLFVTFSIVMAGGAA